MLRCIHQGCKYGYAIWQLRYLIAVNRVIRALVEQLITNLSHESAYRKHINLNQTWYNKLITSPQLKSTQIRG